MNEQNPVVWPGWRTVRAIGRGSYGAVYEVEREIGGELERAAVKCISLPQSTGDIEDMLGNGYDRESLASHFDNQLQDITREYKLMADLKGNSNIVSCEDFICDRQANGIGWDVKIRMELLTPMMRMENPPAPEALALGLGRDLCKALILCTNRNIVHRDIKPQNIFVSRDGDYKLGDFGIARTMEKTAGATKTGTYNYMAPEVYNNRPYGHQADVYSLGMVLYWALNERRGPFLPLPPRVPTATEQEQARLRRFDGEALPPPAHGSEGLKRIVLKACAFDPKDRYAHAGELYNDLQLIGTAREAEAGKPTAPAAPKTASGKKKSKAPLLGVLAAAAALAVLAGIFLPRLREGAETGMAPEPADTVEDESLNPTPEAEPEDDPEEPGIVLYEKDGVSYALRGTSLCITGLGEMTELSNALSNSPELKYAITEITVDGEFSAIPEWAFDRCSSLQRVTIADSVESIGDYAFYYCNALSEVNLPASLTSIGEGAFIDCASLKEIHFDGTVQQWKEISTGAVDPYSVTVVCSDGELPPSDKSFCGYDLTWTMDSEGKLIISGSGDMWFFTEKSAPWKKTEVKSVVISQGVTNVSEMAFYQCANLTEVSIPGSVTRIGGRAFGECRSLASVSFSEGLTTIGGYAFSGCSSLTEAKLPASVTKIVNNAFDSCGRLQSVSFSANVTHLGADVFVNCPSLTNVYFYGTKEQLEAILIYPGNEAITDAKVHYITA